METWHIVLVVLAVVIGLVIYFRYRCPKCGKLKLKSTGNKGSAPSNHRLQLYEVRCQICGFTKWRKVPGSGGAGFRDDGGGFGGGGGGGDGG